MITQTNPPIEAQPAIPAIEHEPHIHLPRIPHLHAGRTSSAPEKSIATSIQTPNIALAGLQLIVGYEWLVSGVDKLLIGVFPTSLSGLLTGALAGGRLPSFFAAILRGLVMPNAILFGYLIEWSETLAGLALVTVALVTLLRPFIERHLRGTSETVFTYSVRLLERLAPLAATGMGLLGLSFFFLDGLPKPWFIPSIAYGGAIDTGLFLAAASIVLVVGQLVQQRSNR